jgi:YfiH family protein
MPGEIVAKLAEDVLLRPARWPAGGGALMTTRAGGISTGPFASLNLRAQPGHPEDVVAVAENRRRFAATLAAAPVFLEQVHGTRVVRLAADDAGHGLEPLRADASITTTPGIACTVQVADCLPVLFATRDGRGVGAAHAGWRGLAGGVLEATVAALREATRAAPGDIVAWLGACIGPDAFEVGEDVREAFDADETRHFRAAPARDGRRKWFADLPALARGRLLRLGLVDIEACGLCTASDTSRFFSYRREGLTGRLAAAAWIDAV